MAHRNNGQPPVIRCDDLNDDLILQTDQGDMTFSSIMQHVLDKPFVEVKLVSVLGQTITERVQVEVTNYQDTPQAKKHLLASLQELRQMSITKISEAIGTPLGHHHLANFFTTSEGQRVLKMAIGEETKGTSVTFADQPRNNKRKHVAGLKSTGLDEEEDEEASNDGSVKAWTISDLAKEPTPPPKSPKSPKRAKRKTKTPDITSPRTRQQLKATSEFPKLPKVVMNKEGDEGHIIDGSFYTVDQCKNRATGWLSFDGALKNHLQRELGLDFTDPDEAFKLFMSCFFYHSTQRRSRGRKLVLPYYMADWMNQNTSVTAAVTGVQRQLYLMLERDYYTNTDYYDSHQVVFKQLREQRETNRP